MTASIWEISSTQTSITVGASWSSSTSAYYVQFFVDADDGSRSSSQYSVSNKTNDSRTFTYSSGLSAGKQYKCYVRYFASNGTTVLGTAVVYIYTQSIPIPAPSNPSISTSVSGNTITIRVTAGDNTDYVDFFSDISPTYERVYITSYQSFTRTRTGSSGQSYQFKAQAINDGVTSSIVSSTAYIPKPTPSTPTGFYSTGQTENTISLSWNSASNADWYSLEWYRSADGSFVNGSYTIYSTSYTITGLLKGVSYDIKLYSRNSDGTSGSTWIYGVKTKGARPNNFGWSTTKSKGSSYTITNNQFQNLVTYDEVIAFQSRVNEFRDYKNLSSYSFSSKYKGQTITRSMYNEWKSAIDAMSPPTSTYTSGDLDVLMNRLRDSLNSIT